MSLITDILGPSKSTDISEASYTLLDDLFSYNAVWLQNAIEIANIPFLSQNELLKNIPLPLIGFAYKLTGDVQLLSYEWSQYPFLSKQMITNSGMKQQTRFSLDVYSVLSNTNPVALNLLKITALVSIIDNYVARGGLFTVLTMYGFITDCVLESITGLSDGEMLDGTHLRFNFIKPNIDSTAAVTKQLSDLVSSIDIGKAVNL